MKNIPLLILSVLIPLLIVSCDTSTRTTTQNTSAVSEELKSRKITKIPSAQIYSKALAVGDEARTSVEKQWLEKLDKAIDTHPILVAIDSCSIKNLPIKDSLEKNHSLSISRVSLTPINKTHLPDKESMEILDAYHYNFENNISSSANIQKINPKELLYTYPIVFNEDYCLKCHGGPDKETLNLLQERYGIDSSSKALNHKKGEIAGMWKIVLEQKYIINNLD